VASAKNTHIQTERERNGKQKKERKFGGREKRMKLKFHDYLNYVLQIIKQLVFYT